MKLISPLQSNTIGGSWVIEMLISLDQVYQVDLSLFCDPKPLKMFFLSPVLLLSGSWARSSELKKTGRLVVELAVVAVVVVEGFVGLTGLDDLSCFFIKSC